jgi:hypothetical protein
MSLSALFSLYIKGILLIRVTAVKDLKSTIKPVLRHEYDGLRCVY